MAATTSLPAPILALTNCKDAAEAEKIAQWLVRERLAACVNILPTVKSVYEWQGEIEQATEATLLIKTNHKQFQKIKTKLVEQHSFELPELIGVEITDGLPAYLAWVNENTADETTP